MSTKRRVRRFVSWLLFWFGGAVLVIVGGHANVRYEKDPGRLPLRSGLVEAVVIDPGDALSIYSPWTSSYAHCEAVSPGLVVESGSGFAYIDCATRWRRIHHLEPAVAGSYTVECDGDTDVFLLAAAVPGSRVGRLMAAGIVNAGWLLILGIPAVALLRTIVRVYLDYDPTSRLRSGWPGS